MNLHHLREAAHDHVLRHTLFPDPDLQREKQATAAEKFETEQAEREAYLESLIIAPSTPNEDNPLQARSRFRPKFSQPTKKPKLVSRVAAIRAKQTATHGDKTNDK
jgi:hypothetical protein